jgi:DNA polymerase
MLVITFSGSKEPLVTIKLWNPLPVKPSTTTRDFLANAMLNLEQNGYEIINSIHDEVLLLVDEDKAEEALKNDVMSIMTTPPKWASDFPLAAEGWVSKRYKK